MFGNSLKALRLERNLSQEELSINLNKKYETTISKSMISRWESGQTDPQMTYVRIIMDYFNVDPNTLLGDFSKKTANSNVVNFEINEQSATYNYFDTGISAGLLQEVDPFSSLDTKKIILSDVVLGSYAGDKDVFITHVNGESMNRVLPNNSLIAVKKFNTLQDLRNGDIVIFQDGGDMSIKRFYNNENSNVISFLPDSDKKEFEPIIYRYEDIDQLSIVGKVVVYTVEL